MRNNEFAKRNINKAYTHAGIFHADDVFSTAFLKFLNPNIVIERVFKVPELADDAIAFDIGGGEFDHHQELEFRDEEKKLPYAAFGKLWRAFGHDIVDDIGWKMIDKNLVVPIDMHDNGYGKDVGPNTMSIFISNFNPQWDTNEDMNVAFGHAVEAAHMVLQNFFSKANSIDKAVEIIEGKKDDEYYKNKILVLDQYIPWKDIVKEIDGIDVIFAVYPSTRGGYCIESINSSKYPLPYKWTQEMPEGMTFVHISRFLAAVDTKERAVEYAMQAKEICGY